MEISEEEPVVSRLPAVVHFALVSVVDPVVDAVVSPLLVAVGLGDPLRSLTPVRGDERRGGEEKGCEVQTHGQQGTTFPSGLHRPLFERLSANACSKFMKAAGRRCC